MTGEWQELSAISPTENICRDKEAWFDRAATAVATTGQSGAHPTWWVAVLPFSSAGQWSSKQSKERPFAFAFSPRPDETLTVFASSLRRGTWIHVFSARPMGSARRACQRNGPAYGGTSFSFWLGYPDALNRFDCRHVANLNSAPSERKPNLSLQVPVRPQELLPASSQNVCGLSGEG
jgi:hypothetical protein